MDIGTTIKKLRREHGMTQEQLAEYMGVSVSAVSQWELGKTAPDIGMLPVLCGVFKVSADELLSVNVRLRDAEIEAVINKAMEHFAAGDTDAEASTLEAGLSRFPDSTRLMYYRLTLCDLPHSERIKLCEKILDLAEADDPDRYMAKRELARSYAAIGDTDRAEKLISSLPPSVCCRSYVSTLAYGGDKRIDASFKYLFYDVVMMLKEILSQNYKHDNGDMLYTDDEMASRREKLIGIIRLLFENGDYGWCGAVLLEQHTELARHAARKNDTVSAISHLKDAADAAAYFDSFASAGGATHTSVCFRGWHESSDAIVSSNSMGNDSSVLLRALAERDFDFIRSDPRFIEIESHLTSKAVQSAQ